MIAELNGKPIEPGILASTALYNYGHFTSLIANKGRTKGLNLHLERLESDCRTVFGTALDRDLLLSYIRQAAPPEDRVVLRVTVTDPAIDFGHPGNDLNPHILVTSRSALEIVPAPLNVDVVQYQRDFPEVKHIGLFATVALRRQSQQKGYDDALFYSDTGFISEGATWNIGFIDTHDTIIFPNEPVLPGVTQRLLQTAMSDAGIAWKSQSVSIHDLPGMSTAFATNAAVGVRKIENISQHDMNLHHPLLDRFKDVYADIADEVI